VFSGPIWNWSWVGLRTGATLGWRTRDDGGLRGDAVSLAAFVEVVMPAYLYDLGLGLRVDATLDRTGVAAVSLLVDVDLAVLLAAFALAGARAHRLPPRTARAPCRSARKGSPRGHTPPARGSCRPGGPWWA
jgi:hypothetical protein